MVSRERNIIVNVLCEGELYTIKTFPGEYRNLMMLLVDRINPEDFGECLGMGKCATCAVRIMENQSKLTSFDRNEETTIAKAGIAGKDIRLSCQILIDEHLNGVEIECL